MSSHNDSFQGEINKAYQTKIQIKIGPKPEY